MKGNWGWKRVRTFWPRFRATRWRPISFCPMRLYWKILRNNWFAMEVACESRLLPFFLTCESPCYIKVWKQVPFLWIPKRFAKDALGHGKWRHPYSYSQKWKKWKIARRSGLKEMAVFLFLGAQTIAQNKMKNTHICNKFTKKVTKNIKIDHWHIGKRDVY